MPGVAPVPGGQEVRELAPRPPNSNGNLLLAHPIVTGICSQLLG